MPFKALGEIFNQDNVQSDSMTKAIEVFANVFSNNVSFALLSAIISAIPFKFVFRKQKMERFSQKSPLNLAEHFYTLVFISCQIMMAAFIMLPFNRSESVQGTIFMINMFLFLLFPSWMYHQMLQIGWIKSILMSTAAIAFTLLSIIVLIILVFGLFYGFDATVA